ncbi:Ger(x)C family spore germination protein [Desulfitobacterium sp. Sab5]|uniref:Ger(x)C family spore germination protein n=1 Tax=Desulfitobacterium nosdiversum TaxID=3375356 RepID=UPI003CE83BA5
MNWKRWVLILMILSLPLLTTGCWNRRELDKIGIVTEVGIDQGENQQIVYTVQVIIPSGIKRAEGGSSGQGKSTVTFTSSGPTIFDAVRNLTEESGRRLNYSHTMVIAVGEDMARDGVLPVLDFFVRDHEMRFRTWIVVTSGKAADIVEVTPPLENLSAKNLRLLLKDYDIVSKSVAVNTLDFFNEITDESLQAVVGKVEIANQKEKKGLVLKGAGVFHKDKLVSWLDPMKTRGYLWVRDKIKSGIITIPCPGQEDKLISLEIKNVKSSIKPYIDEGKMKYRIDVTVESSVGDQMCDIDFTDPEKIKLLMEAQQKKVTEEIEPIIEEAQKNLKLDILGLGEATMHRFPKEWKEMKENWEAEFPNAEIEIQVKSKINHTGLISRVKMNK